MGETVDRPEIITASDLLQQHVAMIQQQANQAIQRAIQSEAEIRDIDTDEYAFDPRIGAFVKRDDGGEALNA